MENYELNGIVLGKDEVEPTVIPKPLNSLKSIKIPFVGIEDELKIEDQKKSIEEMWNDINKKRLIKKHEEKRLKLWKSYRDKLIDSEEFEINHFYLKNLKQKEELDSLEDEIEKKLLYVIKTLIDRDYEERAF